MVGSPVTLGRRFASKREIAETLLLRLQLSRDEAIRV
jgi:hypothetical protein